MCIRLNASSSNKLKIVLGQTTPSCMFEVCFYFLPNEG